MIVHTVTLIHLAEFYVRIFNKLSTMCVQDTRGFCQSKSYTADHTVSYLAFAATAVIVTSTAVIVTSTAVIVTSTAVSLSSSSLTF